MKTHLKKKINQVKELYRLYTTGLNRKEVEGLLKKDAMEALEYYKEKTSLKDKKLRTNSFKTTTRGVVNIIFLQTGQNRRRGFF